MSEPVRKRVVFHGRVQGVGFRAFCREAAAARGVRGWVRNMPDGTVEMEGEADLPTLEALLDQLRAGSGWSRVDGVRSFDVRPLRDEAEGFGITTY